MLAMDPRVADAVWNAIQGHLPPRPPDTHPLGCHRPRISDRDCFDGILARLVTGCSWDVAARLCKAGETTLRGPRTEWLTAGVFDKHLPAVSLGVAQHMVGNDGEVPVALAVADLVDPDPQQPTQPAGIALLGDTRSTIPATLSHEVRNNRVIVVLPERWANQATTSSKSREPGPRPRPGHVFGPDPIASPAVQPADLGSQQQLGRAQVQMPPTAHRGCHRHPCPSNRTGTGDDSCGDTGRRPHFRE